MLLLCHLSPIDHSHSPVVMFVLGFTSTWLRLWSFLPKDTPTKNFQRFQSGLNKWALGYKIYNLSLSQETFPKQILDSSKLKEVADDNFKFDKNGKKFSPRTENTLRKGEIACYQQQFLVFPVFLKDLDCRHVKTRACLGNGYTSWKKAFEIWWGKVKNADDMIVSPFPNWCFHLFGRKSLHFVHTIKTWKL